MKGIYAIIPIRMKSSRLPRKALVDIEGYTAIERVRNNLKASKYIEDVIFAITDNKEDDPVEELAKQKKIKYFRGSENDIVSRYIGTSYMYNVDVIVRATMDCPLVSYEITDYLVEGYLKKKVDYTMIDTDNIPIGAFPDIFTVDALKTLQKQNVDLNYSEYIPWYFINNQNIFTVNKLPVPIKYVSNYRLTLDYPEDLELIRNIYREIGNGINPLSLTDVIYFLDNNPKLAKINQSLPTKWKSDKKLIEKLNKVTKI